MSLRFTLHDSSKKKSDRAVKPVWFGSSPSCEKEPLRRFLCFHKPWCSLFWATNPFALINVRRSRWFLEGPSGLKALHLCQSRWDLLPPRSDLPFKRLKCRLWMWEAYFCCCDLGRNFDWKGEYVLYSFVYWFWSPGLCLLVFQLTFGPWIDTGTSHWQVFWVFKDVWELFLLCSDSMNRRWKISSLNHPAKASLAFSLKLEWRFSTILRGKKNSFADQVLGDFIENRCRQWGASIVHISARIGHCRPSMKVWVVGRKLFKAWVILHSTFQPILAHARGSHCLTPTPSAAVAILNWRAPFLRACFFWCLGDEKRVSLKAVKALQVCLEACREVSCSKFHSVERPEIVAR